MEQAKIKFWKMLFLGSISFLIFTARTVLVQASVERVAAPLKTVWINSMKMDVKKFGEEKAKRLQEELAFVMDEENKVDEVMELPEYYRTICLKYEDGTTQRFCLFYKNEIWYMEDADGDFYRDAAFAAEYFPDSEKGNEDPFLGDVYFSEVSDAVDAELESQFAEHDLTWYYVVERKKMQDSGVSEEDAKAYLRQEFEKAAVLYMYAEEHGYTCTEKEIQTRREKILQKTGVANGQEAFFKSFEEKAGIPYAEYLKKSDLAFQYGILIEKLYKDKYDAFRSGEDQIGENVCERVSDYWAEFLTEEVYANVERYDLQEVDVQIAEAEDYYEKKG